MSSTWVFNAPIYLSAIALWGWSSLDVVKWVCVSIFVFAAVLAYLRTCAGALWPVATAFAVRPKVAVQDYLGALTLLFGLLLFVVPAFNPWYMVWWLVLAAVRPSATAWTCSVVLLLSYVSGINLAGQNLQLYEQPGWILWVQFVPVTLALVYDFSRRLRLPT